MNKINTPWRAGKPYTSHAHPTFSWIIAVLDATGEQVAEAYGATAEDARKNAEVIAQSVNVGVGLAALVDARLDGSK